MEFHIRDKEKVLKSIYYKGVKKTGRKGLRPGISLDSPTATLELMILEKNLPILRKNDIST